MNDAENQAWDDIYSLGQSSRYANEGDIGIYYRLPKFVRMFKKHIPSLDGLRVLEIGGGIGEMYENLSADFFGENFDYTITEYSPNAVRVLFQRYGGKDIPAIEQADACDLPFADNSFDVVCAFDVQHHVPDPRQMAHEMLRVSRRHVFLCEPCGLSVIRRITETTTTGKRFGEKSYTPRKIREFFSSPGGIEDNRGGGVPYYTILLLCAAQNTKTVYVPLCHDQ